MKRWGIVLGAAALLALAGQPAGAVGGVLGNKPSYGPDVSATGRYVVFTSDATNLVGGDTNGKPDVFIRDAVAKTTRLVSRGLAGKPANGASGSPSVSDDGRFVAFQSSASNLVRGDTNGVADIFRADLQTGAIVRISVTASGHQANAASGGTGISGNGQSVVFTSKASNLVAKDSNRVADVFLRDLSSPGARRISLSPKGAQLTSQSSQATISNNGAVIGFQDDNQSVYQWARGSGRTQIVDRWSGGGGDCGTSTSPESPRASNGGVSNVEETEGCDAVTFELVIRALPQALSFIAYLDWDYNYGFDVSRWGAMTAYSGYDSLFVADATGTLGRLDGFDAQHLSLSADGSWVAFTDYHQVRLWNWKTKAVQVASTS